MGQGGLPAPIRCLALRTAGRDGAWRAKAAKASADKKKQQAWDLIVETYEALVEERGEGGKIWGSMIKQTLKRRKPGFSESHYGFRSFDQLLEEAGARGILDLEPEEKPGGFIIRGCHSREA